MPRIYSRCFKNIGVALCLSLASIGAIAAESNSEGTHAGEEAHAKHALAVFVGVTREHDENRDTLGIEYSYRINKSWSIAPQANLDVIENEENEEVYGIAIGKRF